VDEDAQPVHRHTLVEIPGVAIRLKPYQAWAAYSILSEEKRKRGGFLADEMGLGKVRTSNRCVSTPKCSTDSLPSELH
jgi:SNF2 family DNA or RNA helicase